MIYCAINYFCNHCCRKWSLVGYSEAHQDEGKCIVWSPSHKDKNNSKCGIWSPSHKDTDNRKCIVWSHSFNDKDGRKCSIWNPSFSNKDSKKWSIWYLPKQTIAPINLLNYSSIVAFNLCMTVKKFLYSWAIWKLLNCRLHLSLWLRCGSSRYLQDLNTTAGLVHSQIQAGYYAITRNTTNWDFLLNNI